MVVSFFAMHLTNNSRIWTKLPLQNRKKFQRIAILSYLPVKEISLALAYYQVEIL